ncbi:MAG: T9SS type A sorting domain-containing protein, partial [Bacteroidota bacterium]
NGTSETFAPVRVSNTRSVAMTVYPVPAREVVTIRTEAATQATITTLDGVVLSEHALNAGDTRIDINHLKAGVYLVRCPASGTDQVARLVVQP